MAACKLRVVPVRIRWYDPGLRSDASRVVGYRALCGEHYRGPVRRSVQEARVDGRAHRRA